MPHLMRCLTISLLFALIAGAPTTPAQSGRSEITGIVKDERDALISQGRILITEAATNQTFTSAGDPRVIQLGAKLNF